MSEQQTSSEAEDVKRWTKGLPSGKVNPSQPLSSGETAAQQMERMRKNRLDDIEARRMEREYSPEPTKPAESPIKITANIDIADMVKTEKEMRQKAETATQEWMQKYWGSEANKLASQLARIEQVAAAKEKSPIETYKEMRTIIDEAKREVFGGGITTTPAFDGATAIRLKELELSNALQIEEMRDDRQQRHDEFMLQVRKWDDEKKLRWANFRQAGDRTEKALGELGILAQSVVGALNEGGVAQGIPAGGGKKVGSNVPTADFVCTTCGETMKLHYGQTKVACPTCQDVHEIVWERAPTAERKPAEDKPVSKTVSSSEDTGDEPE